MRRGGDKRAEPDATAWSCSMRTLTQGLRSWPKTEPPVAPVRRSTCTVHCPSPCWTAVKTVSPVTTKGCTGLRRSAGAGAVYAGWMERFTWLVTSRLSTHEALPPTTYAPQ